MNIFLNEYFGFCFELNFELNHFLARFNEKINFQNVSNTPMVECNNELGTWAHVAGAERTFGWVLSCDSAGPVVKWPLHGKKGSTAMRGSYQDLDILTPPTNSPIFKL